MGTLFVIVKIKGFAVAEAMKIRKGKVWGNDTGSDKEACELRCSHRID